MVSGGETAAIVVTVVVVLIVLAILRYMSVRREVPHILDEEEIAFKKRGEVKAKRKRSTKRAKKDFEDRRTLLDDYEDLDNLDQAVLDSFDVELIDADLDELDAIMEPALAAIPNPTTTPSTSSSTTTTTTPTSTTAAGSTARSRARSTRQTRAKDQTAIGLSSRLTQLDDDDDDLEAQLTAPVPPQQTQSHSLPSTE